MVDDSHKQEAIRWIRQGVAALRTQDMKTAQRCLIRAKDLDPENAEVWLYLAVTTRDLDKRRLLLEKAVAVDPAHQQARRALAELERQQQAAPEVPVPEEPPAAEAPVPVETEEIPAATEERRCPRCGAVLRYDEQRQAMVCVFCGHGTGMLSLPLVRATRVHPEQPWPAGLIARRCLNCESTSLLPPGKPPETPCPVCMRPVLEPAEIAVPFPDGYLAFRVDEARAAVALEDVELPGGLRRILPGGRQMTRPRPVLIPVWIVGGLGFIRYRQAERDMDVSERFTELLIPGMRQLSPALLNLVARVPLDRTLPCEAVLTADTRVFMLLPGVLFQAAVQEGNALIGAAMRRRASQGQGLAVKAEVAETGARNLTIQQVLLPAWINEVRAGGKAYMGLVNGVTGEAGVGSLPNSGRG